MGEGDALVVDGRPHRVGPILGEGRTSHVHAVLSADGGDSELVVKIRREVKDAGPALDPEAFITEVERLRALREQAGADAECFTRIHAVDPGGAWFVMDRAYGVPLSVVIRDCKILRAEQIVSVGRRLAAVLHAARALGIRNVDLKLDAIFYELTSDRLVVVDWNVCTPWRPERGWIDPDARLVVALIDGLLQNAMTPEGGDRLPDWRRRFERPARWASYPHIFQSAFAGLLVEREAQIDLDEVSEILTRLSKIISMPDHELLEHVLTQLDRHRAAPEQGAEQIREALGLAQLVARSPRKSIALCGRAALLASTGLLGADRGSIARMWAGLADSRSDVEVPAGTAPELERLRRLGIARRRAIGIADHVHRVAVAFAHLKWREAARQLDEIARVVDHPSITEQLEPLAAEAKGMVQIKRALTHLDQLDLSTGVETGVHLPTVGQQHAVRAQALAELQQGIERLARVPWCDLLLARLPEIIEQRDALRAQLGATASAPAARPGADGPSPDGSQIPAASPDAEDAPPIAAPITRGESPGDRKGPALWTKSGTRFDLTVVPIERDVAAIRRPRPVRDRRAGGDELEVIEARDTAEELSPGHFAAHPGDVGDERDLGRDDAAEPVDPSADDPMGDYDDDAPTTAFAADTSSSPPDSTPPPASDGERETDDDEEVRLPRRSRWPWVLGAIAAGAALWVLAVGLPESTRGADASLDDGWDTEAPAHARPMQADAAPPKADMGAERLDASVDARVQDARVQDAPVKDARAGSPPRLPRKPTGGSGRPVKPVAAPPVLQPVPVTPEPVRVVVIRHIDDSARDAGPPPPPVPDKGVPFSPEDRALLFGGSR